jgi:uridine kinase
MATARTTSTSNLSPEHTSKPSLINPQNDKQILTVGISGPPSSGKSTLAFLLNSIFNPNPNPSTSHIINQDSYFLPKPSIPHSSFLSFNTPENINFLARSVEDDKIGLYTYEKIDGKGEKGRWRISGPDTDCAASLDFTSLVQDVESAKCSEFVSEIRAQVKDIEDDPSTLLQKHASLISEMRELVRSRLRHNRFCFVEGFLLFTQPRVSKTTAMSELEFQREKLMGLLDVKLFLPTDKEEAKKRRFKRKAYIDVEKGGLRVSGQMWKCEGYFEEVAWGNYGRGCGWVLKGEGKDSGICVRPGEVLGIEETVRWGVGVLLGELGMVDGKWRKEVKL